MVDRRREISSKDPPLPYVYGYQQMDGIPRFRAALAKTIQDNVLKEPTDPNNLVALTGLSAILNKMFCAIGSPGDAVLIPAPYYPMFEGDIATRNGLVPIPVHPREVGLESFAVGIVERRERERGGGFFFFSSFARHRSLIVTGIVVVVVVGIHLGRFSPPFQADGSTLPDAECFNRAYNAAKEKNYNPRVVLLTNPNNPTGEIWPESFLKDALEFACAKNMHFLSDEVAHTHSELHFLGNRLRLGVVVSI